MFKVLAAIILSSSIAQANNIPSGHEVANGGFFFECQADSAPGAGVFSMDRLEGESLYSLFAASHFANFAKEDEIIRFILDDLRLTNPTRANQYAKWFEELYANKVYAAELAIKPVADTGTVTIPSGCQLRQAAVFMTEDGTSTGRFIYDESLWERASALDRAYLLLHELIYQEAKLPENAHTNSMATRYLNAYLFAHSGQLKDFELLQILIKTKFRRADYRGIPLVLTSMDNNGRLSTESVDYFPRSNFVRQAVLDDTFHLRIGTQSFSRQCQVPNTTFRNTKNLVEFYPNGRVKRLVFEVFANIPGCGEINGSNHLEFDEAGQSLSR